MIVCSEEFREAMPTELLIMKNDTISVCEKYDSVWELEIMLLWWLIIIINN